ncbi:MAG: hypothetical protein KIT02_12660 [Devosia sp.]|uniref:hypothetical protein n=1 Tax=Devosia sp. TaxID=1871048 RepID=UPI0024CB327B|nr:hypothetical protein [Devosia sp.]UYN98783.1 MAG: hypothetical protein KIT02_12660 [Devosia sp.]
MMGARPKRFPWLGYAIAFCLIGAFTMSPAIWLAVVNAQEPGPPIGLTDLMASWGLFGWLIITPFSLGPFLIMAWALVLAMHHWAFRRRRRKEGGQ